MDEPLFLPASTPDGTERADGRDVDGSKASLLSPRERELRRFYRRRAAVTDFLIKYSLFVSNFLFWVKSIVVVLPLFHFFAADLLSYFQPVHHNCCIKGSGTYYHVYKGSLAANWKYEWFLTISPKAIYS